VHVGDAVRVRAQNGKMVAPLVTGEFYTLRYDNRAQKFYVGSFGASDFMHSLLGGTCE
jgi:hypothetical protein